VKTKDEILTDVYQMLGCDAEIKELMGVATRARVAATKVQGSDYTVKSDGRTVTFGSYIPAAMAETQPIPADAPTRSLSDIKPQTSTIDLAERLRQALLARMAA
jgi:hypothetical protein